MNVISVDKGLNLSNKENYLLQIVNEYPFELSDNHIICFGDLLKEVRIVLDHSASRSKILDSSLWKMNDPFLKQKGVEIDTFEPYVLVTTEEKSSSGDTLYPYQESIKKLRNELKDVKFHKGIYIDSYKLKGLFRPSDKSIILYMDNMSETNKEEDVVSVYIHEMFHAYYHSLFKWMGESVREIEECMVEFSMLTFLESLSETDKPFKEIYEYAKNVVEGKRWKIGDLAAYGFGKYVFDKCHNKKEWISEYTKKSRFFDKKKPIVAEYVGRVYPFYPIRERDCYELLELILFSNDGSDSNPKVKFKLMDDFHDLALRILLIDDKIDCKEPVLSEEKNDDESNKDSGGEKPENETKKTDENTEVDKKKNETKVDVNENETKVDVKVCVKSCSHHKCKLCTIKRLMGSGEKDDKVNVFDGIGIYKDYFYWKEQKIECYYCPTITRDFIDNVDELNYVNPTDKEKKNRPSGDYSDYECTFYPDINRNNLNVQIVGVRDVRTALLLMSRYKFDMIFCDYLLDYKNENKVERDYIKQLFEFLSHNYKKDIEKENDKDKIKRLKVLEQLRHDVLDNRGPLGKFWIMPVTGFNQTFIQDLHRSGINLIDYRWNISNGADPITTPWQFLYHLNKFIELQLRSCVYTMEQLLTFLLYTCQDLNTIEETVKVRDKEEKIVYFDDFQSFMGSEYATLVRLYGNKFPIKRDAVTKEEEENSGKAQYKSVFATYVWENFYANQERKYVNEIELYRLLHRFYHRASVMYEDQRGKKLLNDAFSSLWFFLHSNYKVREEIKKNATLEELYKNGEGLNKLKEVVEKCTADKKRDKDKE